MVPTLNFEHIHATNLFGYSKAEMEYYNGEGRLGRMRQLCLRNNRTATDKTSGTNTRESVVNKTKRFVFDFEAICVIGQC